MPQDVCIIRDVYTEGLVSKSLQVHQSACCLHFSHARSTLCFTVLLPDFPFLSSFHPSIPFFFCLFQAPYSFPNFLGFLHPQVPYNTYSLPKHTSNDIPTTTLVSQSGKLSLFHRSTQISVYSRSQFSPSLICIPSIPFLLELWPLPTYIEKIHLHTSLSY